MKNSPFTAGDLVAVFGGEIGKEGKHANSVLICKVLVVGEKDLIVEDSGHRFIRNAHNTIPQSICHKLFLDPDKLTTEKTLSPQIGDLVLSYSRDSYKDEEAEQINGILYKINYKLGKPDKCSILCGSEMKEAVFDNLLVLQSKIKN